MDNTPIDFVEPVQTEHKNGFIRFIRRLSKMKYFYLLGAFFLPVVLMAGAHAACSFFPIGNQSILSLDFQAQYIYYFEYVRKLLVGEGGGSWFYTWSRTLGGEFMGYVAYYMASPFNLITVLFSQKNIALAASVIVLLKCGTMGATMGYYLHNTRGTRDVKTMMFSTLYALCGYVAIQQFNPMWLDALIWLPLLVYGIEKLVKEKKVILYIVSLAAILYSNYYIGYMCCIFTVIYYFYYYILVRPEMLDKYKTGKTGLSKFFSLYGTRSFLRILFSSVVGILMASFMLICAYYSLGFGKMGFSNPSFAFKFKFDFLDIFVKMLLGSHDTVRDNGLPVVYSGMYSLILLPAFYFSKGIAPRKKALSSGLLLVLLVSFLINPVDLFWHGLSMPNWLNFRYSFLFCFVVVCMACDAFMTFDKVRFSAFAASSGVILALIAVVQKFKYEFKQSSRTVKLDDILCIGLSVLFVLIYVGLSYALVKCRKKNALTLALAVFISIEVLVNSIISIAYVEDDVGVVRYHNYTNNASRDERFDSHIGSVARNRLMADLIKENDTAFYRMESTIYRQRGGVNEQMAGGFYGISSSTSTLNAKIILLMNKLGYASQSHWTKYLGGTPIGDALLGIKYVITSNRPKEGNGGTITRNNKHSFDNNIYVTPYEIEEPYEYIDSNYKIYAKQNTKALPIAYGVSRSLLGFEDVLDMNVNRVSMELQNMLINSMLSERVAAPNVFKPLKMSYTTSNVTVTKTSLSYSIDGVPINSQNYVVSKVATGQGSVTFHTTAVADGVVYMQFPTYTAWSKKASVYVNGVFLTEYFTNETACAMELGTFKAGDNINVELRLNNGDVTLDKDKLYIAADTDSFFWYVDYAAMNEAFDYLSEAGLYVEKFNNSSLEGYISVPQGQELVFTTIPYDAGWNVYVDGKKVETKTALGALLAFETTAGEHEIKMNYMPKIYLVGMASTAVGFILFALIVLYRFNEKFRLLVGRIFVRKKEDELPGGDLTDEEEAAADEYAELHKDEPSPAEDAPAPADDAPAPADDVPAPADDAPAQADDTAEAIAVEPSEDDGKAQK